MKKNRLFSILSIAILFVFITSLFSTTIVLADDGTPPAPTEEPAQPPTEEAAAETEAASTSTPEADVTEEVPSTPEADSESTMDETTAEPEETDITVAEAFEQLPEGTEIVIINAEGEIEPLATQEATEIIAEADPIWCPVGTDPTTANAGLTCSPSYSTMTDLLNWLNINDPGQDGIIWIEKTYDSAAEGVSGFYLDGAVLTNMSSYNLTIQGGWNGLDTTTVDTTAPSTFTGDSLAIYGWTGNVTIKDITVNGVTSGGDSIYVDTTGDIHLENITSNNNTDRAGAYLTNIAGTGTGSVTLSGTNTFNNNTTFGLYILARGAITLNNITANDTVDSYGAYVDNCYDFGGGCEGTGAVTMTGTNVFNGNNNTGLYIISAGQVALNNVTASNNTNYDGVSIDNRYVTESVTMTGTNVFNNNGQNGLSVISKGNISLNNLTAGLDAATGNGQTGVRLDNCDYFGGGCTGSGYISLTGMNVFNGNGSYGLDATSNGDISGSNLTAGLDVATGNVFGAYLSNNFSGASGKITLTGTNIFNGNDEYGLTAASRGDISLNNVTASDNDLGALLMNFYSVTSGKITLTGTNIFNGNNDVGLAASSSGDISLNNVTANDNADNTGASLQTIGGSGTVSLTGTNTFNGNGLSSGGEGLQVVSDGIITIQNLTAAGNNANGALLDNQAGTADVTLNGTNLFHDNTNSGLVVLSNGNITVNNVTAYNHSTEAALYLDPAIPTNIAVNCANIHDNSTGIFALYSGTLTLNTVTFTNNSVDYIDAGPSLVVSSDCNPVKTVAVDSPSLPIREVFTSGGSVVLDCEMYRGTQLILPNGDFAYFPCPIEDNATLVPTASDNLPGDLPDGTAFQSAFETEVTQDGVAQDTLVRFATISFDIPDGVDASSLSILYWDGEAWVELSNNLALTDGRLVGLGNFVSEDGLSYQATLNFTGIFALVSQ